MIELALPRKLLARTCGNAGRVPSVGLRRDLWMGSGEVIEADENLATRAYRTVIPGSSILDRR
jgi:hypothetical protein